MQYSKQEIFAAIASDSSIFTLTAPVDYHQNGLTPLHLAAQLGNTKWVRALLQISCNVDALSTPSGQTPIMLAASNGFLHSVKALIEAGANLSTRDSENRSCLDLCSIQQGKGCIRAIKQGLEGKMEKRIKDACGQWRTRLVSINDKNERIGDSSTGISRPPSPQRGRTPTDWKEFIKPIKRHWISIDESIDNQNVRIVSYNILAQCYTRSSYFPWATSEQLNWNHRGDNLIKELLSYEADILCLQEVDHFEFLQSNLPNYQGIYQQRTGPRREGCAVFYNPQKFKLVNKEKIEFNEFTNETRLQKDNIALFVKLESVVTRRRLVLGTTHLYYKSKAAREQQAKCFLDQVMLFANGTPFVLCGDFNCMPQSDTILRFYGAGLKSGFDEMIAAAESATFLGGKHSKKWYDFIFHSSEMKVSRILSLPACGETLLPNEFLSSDHVALVEDLQFL